MMRAATRKAREDRVMGTGDKGGERSTVTRVKKRVRLARATAKATWVAGDEEGKGDGGKGNGNKGERQRQGRWQRRQRGRWRRRQGWRETKRARVTVATAMETATKASDGDKGDGVTVVGERR